MQELENEVLASVTDDPLRRRRLLNQAERALALAVAALQRELYATEHPSVSPQPQHRPRPGTQR
ncbi:hypothetical protein [Nocardia araoensis]|uniref:hypothetical protein n=1 Tax=Nocardia araoensis TaxID=228600 RepID=UPI00030C20AC|nr:hypothetical protein [Nocardia araoensis]